MSDNIRAVERVLKLIRLMNEQESWTLHELSLRSGLAKSTVHRLLHTLEAEGYVNAASGRLGVYRLTGLTHSLACGLTKYSLYADVAEPIVNTQTRALGLPLSFAMAEGTCMRIVACGMPYSRFAVKPTSIGRRHRMFNSAVGKVYLAYCSKTDRRTMISAAVSVHDASCSSRAMWSFKTELRDIRRRGFATRYASADDINSAFAVPVEGEGGVYGALACSTFRKSLDDRFIATMLNAVKDTATMIAEALVRLR